MEYLRIWTEVDIEDIKAHIVMVDDIQGYCPQCKKIGIDLKNISKCPSCSREFKYVTSKDASGGKVEIVLRTRKKLPDLIFIDYNDYERITGRNKAESLFKI
jgi:hypothetical protein